MLCFGYFILIELGNKFGILIQEEWEAKRGQGQKLHLHSDSQWNLTNKQKKPPKKQATENNARNTIAPFYKIKCSTLLLFYFVEYEKRTLGHPTVS